MENKKSYYAIIPATVRYDADLVPNAKLLYGEITALCNEKGYCWASNRYFADLYGVSTDSISRWIAQLAEKFFVILIFKEGDRQIYLGGYGKKAEGGTAKMPGGYRKNAEHNNTVNTTKNISEVATRTSPPKESIPADSEMEVVTDDEFMSPADIHRRDAVSNGYKGHLVTPILKWAVASRGGKGFVSVLKQKNAISSMLKVGYSEEDIKSKWTELLTHEFWAERGFDFSTVANEIQKTTGKKSFKKQSGSGHVSEDIDLE